MSEPPAEAFRHLVSRFARVQQPSSIREICALVARPEVRSLAGGWPGPDTFPVKEVAEITADVLREHGAEALQYGATEGLPPLRAAMAEWLHAAHGLDCGAEDVIVTHGSQQGMDLAFRTLVDPGDVVLVGLPTYFGSTGALAMLGGRAEGVPVDDEGMDVDAARARVEALRAEGARVKAIYVIPNFQNPTGVCLSRARREALLALAAEQDLLIIEDDPYGELRFEGKAIPPLAALAAAHGAAGRVIHLHSMSKTFAPGLRVSFTLAEPGLLRRMVVAKQYVDACTETLGQYLALEFIRRGWLDRQIQRNIVFYRSQRDALLAAMDRHFPKVPGLSYSRPRGGFFVFVHLPQGEVADVLVRQAVARNVAFVSGSQFHVNDSGKNTFRLSYAQSDAPTLEVAAAEIGALLTERLG